MLLLWVKSVCEKDKWKADVSCWLGCLWEGQPIIDTDSLRLKGMGQLGGGGTCAMWRHVTPQVATQKSGNGASCMGEGTCDKWHLLTFFFFFVNLSLCKVYIIIYICKLDIYIYKLTITL